MAIVIAFTGATQIGTKYFKNILPISGNNLTLKLFTNNVSPVPATVAVDLTVAVGGGYADITLLPSTAVVSTVLGVVQVAYPQQTFSFTGLLIGPQIIYGYYIVDADGVLICSERNSVAFSPTATGGTLFITPIIKIGNGTPV